MAEVKEALKKSDVGDGKKQGAEIERRPSMAGDGNPLAFMNRFAEEMDRVFEDFGMRLPGYFGRGREMLRREIGLIPAQWSPRVEVREVDGRFQIRADLPGLSKEDIQVELADQAITIRGERKQEKKEDRKGFSYSECSYGSFFRAIPLPEGIDTSRATAEFRDGVLEIVMPAPSRQESKARRIEIQDRK